jgi:DNA-binding transcriptional MocR family regulator
MAGERHPPLYRRVAARLERAIAAGTYPPGSRIPSVRGLHADWKVSINTVLEAYRELERRGLVLPQPRSGYVVAPRRVDREPQESKPDPGPTGISIRDLVLRVLRDSRDAKLLPLGAAIPDPSMLPLAALARELKRVERSHGEAVFRYDFPPGHPPLRAQVARRLTALGCAVGPEDVAITVGGMEAITLALRATTKPGDIVAVESPAYYGTFHALDALGLRAIEIPSSPRDGLNLGALRFALDGHAIAAVLVVPNFSNPVGSRMGDEAKRELAALLAGRDIPLIEDDIYGDLAHDGSRPGVCKALDEPGDRGRILLCGSFSKTVAPGLRLGWVAGGRYQQEILHLKIATTLASPTTAQFALAELLASGAYDRHLRRVRPAFARSTAAMANAVLAHFPAGTLVTRPSGGYLLWVEMPPACDAMRLYDQALKSGITVAPGPLFSAGGRYRHHLRLNATVFAERHAAGIALLGRLAHQLARPRRVA